MSAPKIPKSAKTQKENPVVEKFRPIKPKIGKSDAKALVSFKGDIPLNGVLWIENWLQHLQQERSLPPSISRGNAMASLVQLLPPSETIIILERLRVDFRSAFPMLFEKPKDDWQFLLDALEDEKSRYSQDHSLLPA